MEKKKYPSIERKLKDDFLQSGVNIIIQEKIDGANASFAKDENGNLKMFSRNKQLDESETLRGFYGWVVENINADDLDDNKIYFGEWTAKHKIDYGDNLQKFYLFDVYDSKEECYLQLEQVQRISEKLKLETVPLFYNGEFKTVEHVMSFVGKTVIGGKIGDTECGEGIVLKRYDYKGGAKFHKILSEKFSEKIPRKPKEFKATPEQLFVEEFTTPARVEKMLFKLFDEGHLEGEPDSLEYKDIGKVMKLLVNSVREDIIREEADEFTGDEPINIKNMNKALGYKVSQALINFINSI